MINKLSNNWAVLSNEEMNNVKGGMVEEDPNTFAVQDPDGYAELLNNDPQEMLHWYEVAGYNRGQAMRSIRKFLRRYYGYGGGC